ncbi:MAG: FmdE family protein, partial [Thermodesulfobacteriota bacterium]|nr:FmdE family protein [Thermodesulfobacteriota bacterium]
PGWDSVVNAQTGYMSPIYLRLSDEHLIDILTLEAVNFHGEECVGLTIGVQIALKVMRKMNTGMRDPELSISLNAGGCLIDTVQGYSGATVGNGRLIIKGIDTSNECVVFVGRDKKIRAEIEPYSHLTSQQVAMMNCHDMFTLIEE